MTHNLVDSRAYGSACRIFIQRFLPYMPREEGYIISKNCENALTIVKMLSKIAKCLNKKRWNFDQKFVEIWTLHRPNFNNIKLYITILIFSERAFTEVYLHKVLLLLYSYITKLLIIKWSPLKIDKNSKKFNVWVTVATRILVFRGNEYAIWTQRLKLNPFGVDISKGPPFSKCV